MHMSLIDVIYGTWQDVENTTTLDPSLFLYLCQLLPMSPYSVPESAK